ncbi:MAG: hypothetical protein E2O35_01305 [Proteobacteria bacterium]|nr:MAG: hypothetical protein E2O35_01305 [Pseudomonadota bacterium]
MRSKFLIVGLLICALGDTVTAQEDPDPAKEHDPPDTASENPEHTRRSLPADTFKPSEEISEDFSVPFPVDI